VFTLARAVVGIHHAAFAVLLMVGISAFTAPTPNFGPAVLAMPLTAFALLNLWRAVGERQRPAWFLLALLLGLLLLTTYAGLVVIAAILAFLLVTRRGRRALRSADPWLASMMIVVVLFPHLIWLDQSGTGFPLTLQAAARAAPLTADLAAWLRQLEALFLAHAGLLVLVALGSKWTFAAGEKVPVFVRSFTDPFGRRFVYFFALVPPLAASLAAVLLDDHEPAGTLAAFLVLSGLAIIVLAGNAIPWHRPRLVAMAWALLLLVPPLAAAAAIAVLPWLGVSSVDVGRPAAGIGSFFAESFERRTGSPLKVVSGEPRLAALVALGARRRPSVYFDAAPERSPWITAADIARLGAVLVWPSNDTRAQVPGDIAARFPGTVAEVPRTFERMIQGRLPLLRIGWALVRPEAPAKP
jgi:4-amino-4-deoxy-L-arabinose transferase-like glycosyltransferase